MARAKIKLPEFGTREYFDRYPLREAAMLLDVERQELGATEQQVAQAIGYSLSWTKKVLAGKATAARVCDLTDAFLRDYRRRCQTLGIPTPGDQAALDF